MAGILSFRRWIAVVLFLTSLSAIARAEETQPAPRPFVQERAWILSYEFDVPYDNFDSQFRAIDVQAFRAAHAWKVRYGLEGQLGALVFLGFGTKSDPLSSNPTENSNAGGIGFGPSARWNFLQTHRFRVFADGESDFIYALPQFPAGGSATNAFLRAGGGVAYRFGDKKWIEAGYRRAHVSNGGGIVPSNPAWNGKGIYVGVRFVR